MKQTECDKCKREIRNNNFLRHYESCGKEKFFKYQQYEKINNKYKCPYCDNLLNKLGINAHIWKKHTEAGKVFIQNKVNKLAWNKGLTKETNNILKLKSEKSKERFKKGELVSNTKGKKYSQQLKDKIS